MCGILLIAEVLDSRDGCMCSCSGTAQPPSGGTAVDTAVTAECAAPAGAARAAASSPAAPPAAFLLGLQQRGPDHVGACSITVTAGTRGSAAASAPAARLLVAASLLQLRGAARVAPPLAAGSGSVLCFNGEIFGGLHVSRGANDGEVLLEALEKAAADGGAGPPGIQHGQQALACFAMHACGRAGERRLMRSPNAMGCLSRSAPRSAPAAAPYAAFAMH